MTPIESYFDAIYCLTLKRRADRRARADALFSNLGFAPDAVEWVHGPDKPKDFSGKPNGNQGCTEGHGMILDHIVACKIPRSLVFEDDVALAPISPEKLDEFVDPQRQFAEMVNEVPVDWDMLYLGGQYADNPQYRVSEHVIRFNKMLTTSSYGITLDMAKVMQKHIHGVGPIDSLYGGFQPKGHCYVFEPRLFVQGPVLSDLTDKVDDNRHCMIDRHHVEMLIDGEWRAGSKELLDSKLYRRELAARTDMNGEEVIVGRDTYIVRGVQTPEHPAPWFRGEPVTYFLQRK